MIKQEIRYHENGIKSAEVFKLNGKLHNKKGPALILYNKGGFKYVEKHCLNGKLHNENGPSLIHYYDNGNVHSRFYYLNNECLEQIKSLSELKRYIKLNNIS